eukprot:gene23785-9345_t
MRKRLEEVAAQHLLKSPKKFALPPNPALLLLSPELQKMERLEAVRLARSILHCKSEFEASNNVKLHLSDYLYVYLSKKYGNIHTCTEIAFNLLFALGQYMHNPECSIFVKVFLGEVEETIFDAQIELKKKIIDAFTKEDIEQNHRATGWLCKKEMHTVLGELYPEEADLKQLHELLTALDEDYNKPMVNYTKIFDEYSEGCSNTFAETVLQQQIDERVAFLLATEDALLDQVSSESCTAANLSAALKKCHPDMEPEYAQELVERVFGASDMEVSKESKKGSKKGGKASSKSLPLSTALNLLRSPLSENSISLEDAMELATGKKVVILIQQAAHVEENSISIEDAMEMATGKKVVIFILQAAKVGGNSISLEDAMEMATGKKVVIFILQAAQVGGNSISIEDAMEMATGKKVVIFILQAAQVGEKPAKKGKGKKKK